MERTGSARTPSRLASTSPHPPEVRIRGRTRGHRVPGGPISAPASQPVRPADAALRESAASRSSATCLLRDDQEPRPYYPVGRLRYDIWLYYPNSIAASAPAEVLLRDSKGLWLHESRANGRRLDLSGTGRRAEVHAAVTEAAVNDTQYSAAARSGVTPLPVPVPRRRRLPPDCDYHPNVRPAPPVGFARHSDLLSASKPVIFFDPC